MSFPGGVMKTTWSVDYLNSKMSGQEQARWCSRKRVEFEALTGVKWSWFSAHGKVIFNPVLDCRNVTGIRDAAMIESFNAAYKAARDSLGYVGFKRIYESSGLSYPEVMGVAKGLVEDGRAGCGVDRMGKANSIKVY